MAKTLFLAVLLFGAAACTPVVAGSQEDHNSPRNNQEAEQQLSPKQMEVWNEEQNYFRYLQTKDLKSFMSLWDDSFVGWPDYSEHPLRKADIESGVAEEFRDAQAHARPIPLPKPESIVVLGDLAVTYYFWPEADEASPVKYRVTHTWRKGPKGWGIIGGMGCAAPCSSSGISYPLSASPASKLKMHGPEVMNLMLGTWAIKSEYAPSKEMPNGDTGEGLEEWWPGPGGYSLIEEFQEKNANGEISGFGPVWWDAEWQGRRFVWCESTNLLGCELSKNVAKWEGNRLVYREDREENGKQMTHEEVFEDITPVSFLQTLSEGPAGGELKRVATIHAVKVLGTTMKPAEAFSDGTELVTLTNAWTDAINTKDRARLDELMAPEYAHYGWSGELWAPRSQWLDNLFNHVKIRENTLRELSPRVYGDFAIVTSVGTWAGTWDGEPFNQKTIVVDTWRRINGRWQVVTRTSHTEDVTTPIKK
jgi:ketosteroid isomerase-like protein